MKILQDLNKLMNLVLSIEVVFCDDKRDYRGNFHHQLPAIYFVI